MHGLELLEDMDTSDDDQSENSNISDDDEIWVRTKERPRRHAKKRNSKTDSHVETIVDSEQSNLMTSGDSVCCSCSKSSSCKTTRCECRAANGSCCSSCNCAPTRCSNRGDIVVNDLSRQESIEGAGNLFESDERERSNDLASHGAMLLRTALSEKPGNKNDGGVVRKPLSDIGNSLVSVFVHKSSE